MCSKLRARLLPRSSGLCSAVKIAIIQRQTTTVCSLSQSRSIAVFSGAGAGTRTGRGGDGDDNVDGDRLELNVDADTCRRREINDGPLSMSDGGDSGGGDGISSFRGM